MIVLLCAACGDDDAATSDGAPADGGVDAAPGYDEYDVWREMQTVLRASPDHVVGHARALVAAGDAAALFELVRDEVAMLPTGTTAMEDPANRIRWGTRATLRGAAGTPRERAELLRALMTEAGIAAEVVVGAPAAGTSATGLLARSPIRAVAFATTAAQLARWDQALTAPPLPEGIEPLDLDQTLRAAIRDAVTPLVTAPAPEPAFDSTLGQVPLVRLTSGGQTLYANPNLDGIPFGSSGTVDAPVPADPVNGERSLRVLVEASRSDRPAERFPLIEHTFAAGDVAGRSITLAFTVPEDRASASRKKVGQAQTFIPLLRVAGDGLAAEDAWALSAVGAPVTLGGDVITFGAGDRLIIDGEETVPPPTAPGVLAQVATLDVRVRTVAYPHIELAVAARRTDGTSVAGLAADVLQVRDEGQAVAAYVRRNQTPPPRVLLLFDRSSSIPPEFVSGAPTVGHAIADAVFAAFPGALVQVAGIDFNAPSYAGPMVATLAEVDAQLAGLSGGASELWGNLAHAATSASATAVVLVSDGVADDLPTDDVLGHLYGGAPVLAAGVGMTDPMTLARVAEVSDGAVLPGVTAANLAASVVAFLNERVAYDYRIVYDAPPAATPDHAVIVDLATTTVSGGASYVAPLVPVAPDGLSALYLTIETDGRVVTRPLAGSARGSLADRAAVNGALFGKYVLGVEANPPSLSVLLDEHVEERLAYEAVVDAYRAGDDATLALEVERAYRRTPPDLRFFAAGLPGETDPGDVTFVDGLTVTLHATRPVLDEKIVHRIDMLPLVPRRTIRFAGGDTFATTLDRTALLAAAETARFPTSTRALLTGETLGVFDPLTIDLVLGPAWADAVGNFHDYQIVAPVDGSPVAFWAVHAQTGELIGGGPDGAGIGEDESTAALVERLLAILDAAGRAGELAGYNGIAVWAELEAIKVRALGNAIAVLTGEPSQDPTEQLAGEICNAGLAAIAGEIPGIGDVNDISSDLESLQSVLDLISGQEGPQLPDPVAAACNSLLGGG